MKYNSTDYWIYDWAKFRQDEVIRVPQEHKVHKDFTRHSDKNEIISAFTQINSLYTNIYSGIAKFPEEFGMPLYEKGKFRHFSQEWRDSGQAPYRPFLLLYNLFVCGNLNGSVVNVSIEKYKNIKPLPKYMSAFDLKVKNPQFLFNKLSDYGFLFEGLKNNKIAGNDIIISYPDNAVLLYLFKMLADKANNTNRLEDFLCCSFRLLQDDMQTADYGNVEDMVDRVHKEAEKEFVYKMDKALMAIGLFRNLYSGYEGMGLRYYRSEKSMESKGPYSFIMVSRSEDISDFRAEKMWLGLRIRNVSNCIEYLETCPDSVKRIFTKENDQGCGKLNDNSCKHGVAYNIKEKKYWRCACCRPAFCFKPNVKDIQHYIKLVMLGEKK
jgi:hypothetical protein